VIALGDVLARVRQLPAPSASLLRVSALARDERSSASDFEQAIRPDPALTANVLRIANSAYFGLRCRAESIRHAVALLGVRRIAEVASAAALAPIIPACVPGYEMSASDFWRHSVAVAVLAERTAAALKLDRCDGLFTAALLHDVGKLAIASFVASASGEILARSRDGETLVRAEHHVLGLDHAEVGAAVAEAWCLPDAAAAAARWHHAPGQAPEGSDRRAVDVVHLADALAHALGLGADVGELARDVDGGASARVALSAQALERVAAESLEEIADLTALLAGTSGGKR
jgi:putative nucleotidyltransferase with HDIG domain